MINSSKILELRSNVERAYSDIISEDVKVALATLAPLDRNRREIMAERSRRRRVRSDTYERIRFLDPQGLIPRTGIKVADARMGAFVGSQIPQDLRRQWIQGTGPAAKPNSPLKSSIRNVAYALLSGADGWMFDGEDALGQISTMSLDNQRNLKLAIAADPIFLKVAEQVATEMNASKRLSRLAGSQGSSPERTGIREKSELSLARLSPWMASTCFPGLKSSGSRRSSTALRGSRALLVATASKARRV